MKIVMIFPVSLIGGVWVISGAFGWFSGKSSIGWRRGATLLARTLMVSGAAGFFGFFLSAAGGLNWLGNSFEWPAGYVSGVITTPGGMHIVPLSPCGRVQVYDASWKFIRGWHIEKSGKPLTLAAADGVQFHVYTAGSHLDYLFNTDGRMISVNENSPTSRPATAAKGMDVFVPTRWWLWVFSSPGLSWLAVVGGIAATWLLRPADEKSKPLVPSAASD